MKTIKIKMNAEEYFSDVICILKAIPPFSSLMKKELQIYSRMLHYNNMMLMQGMERKSIDAKLFDYEMRRKIQDDVGIGDGSFRNCLSRLKKFGIIDNKKLVERYIIPFGENLTFEFIN